MKSVSIEMVQTNCIVLDELDEEMEKYTPAAHFFEW